MHSTVKLKKVGQMVRGGVKNKGFGDRNIR